MVLEVITTADGRKEIIHKAPMLRCNNIAAPSFKDVQESLTVIKTVSPSDPKWETAMDTIERFIYTR